LGAGLVVIEECLEEVVEFFLGFIPEDGGFGVEAVFESVLGGAVFAFSRDGAV